MPTIFNPLLRSIGRQQSGSALLIALAFVVLLTGLILAFFSRAILEEQVSTSSANQVKVDNFALGAVSSTVSDLKQEIEAGSVGASASVPAYFPVAGNSYVFYYAPTALNGAYPTMLPSPTPGVANLGIAGTAYANLIKISVHGQKFYSTASPPYSGTPTYPNRAAPVSTGLASGDALGTIASGSSDGTSMNGRYISGARWNKPFFLPPNTAFPLPDWIYVYRTPTTSSTGVNYTGANSPLPANMKSSPTDMTTATMTLGRYAYAIYDEGGLLDVNVAGSPTPLASGGSATALGAYKGSLALADLTQIGLNQTQVDTIVGWRNNASAAQWQGTATSTPLSGNFSSGYTWGNINGINYFYNVLFNPTGFLRPISALPSVPASFGQSDQFFTTRQQLIQFINQIASLGGGSTTQAQTSLQYLTHFSRSLEQPSYVPSAGKPSTTVIATGGNDLATSTAGAAEAAINPSFLACRVTTAYTRNDGSAAAVGDLLVKKRFALSRLAWLTYLGPIANDDGSYNSAAGISTIVSILKSYGYTDAFLRQGGPTNIYNYFGLTWLSDSRASIGDNQSKWYYNHETLAAPTSISATAAHIRTLSSGSSTVTSLGRDPDFFELLKASVCLGSLGKAYSTTTASVNSYHNTDPLGYQAALDNSTDGSIIQMGANIIDQFDTDGFSTRILFYDGTFTYPLEFRGVEDLPYLYRVREGKIMVKDSIPTQSTLPTTSTTTLTDPGSGVLLLEPEIWNPHAWNPSSADTNPRPTSFRTVAISTLPGNASSSASAVSVNSTWRWATSVNVTTVQLSSSQSLTEATTALTFTIPTKAQNATNNLELFREPTLLVKAGYPTGSSLASINSSGNVTSLFPAAQYPAGVETTQGSANHYIGMYIATLPMAWTGTVPVKGIDGTNPTTATSGIIPTGFLGYASASSGITFRMQYETSPGSGIWVTYDEKYINYFSAGSYNFPGAFSGYFNHTFYEESASAPVSDYVIGSELSMLSMDPRTSRFGMVLCGPNGRGLSSESFPLGATVGLASNGSPPGSTYSPLFYKGWAAPIGTGTASTLMIGAATQSAILTTRPDENRGMIFSSYDNNGVDYGINVGPTGGTTPQGNGIPLLAAYGGWYPVPTVVTTTGAALGTSAQLQPGLFAQNNPAVVLATATARFAGDPQNPASAPKEFFADPDTIVRRGMAAYVPTGTTAPATAPSSATVPSGMPLKEMMDYSLSPPAQSTTTNEYQSRPIILNRPFRSVGELGYVFSGTPWRNIDTSTPESGAAALLDVFTVNDTDDPIGLMAGKVNLNTKQPLVIQAILNGAYADEFNPGSTGLTSTYASAIATALTNRTQATASGLGPLKNISELIGKWNSSSTVNSTPSVNGSLSFIGFSSDAVNSTNTTTAMYDLTQALIKAGSGTGAAADTNTRVERFRDASLRALSSCGQTRVWNLMIDIIAQTGRFPSSATTLANFNVEGEKRYWVHLAIDRFTGQVLDQQVEEVKE